MAPREINRILEICICRRPISLQIVHGETIRVTCDCGNIICRTFPKKFENRKAELRSLINKEPTNRWEAIAIELFMDELVELEKNC